MQIGIRCRVTLLALISVLPLVVADFHAAKRNEREATNRAQHEALIMSRSLAAGLNDVFDNVRYLLSGFAAAPSNLEQALTGAGCEERLRRLLATSPYHVNMVIANTNGDLVCAARPLSQAINVADRNYFREALERKVFSSSGVIVSRDSGRQVIVVSLPVLDADKRVISVLLATFELAALSHSIRQLGAPDYLVTHLVDEERRILVSWPHVPQWVGQSLKDLGAAFKAGGTTEGIAEIVGADGVARVSAYTRLHDIGGGARYLVTGIPRDEVGRIPRAMLMHDLVALAMTMVIAIALAVWGAHFLVVKPVRALTRSANRYRAGDMGARSGIEHGRDELGNLAASFDALADRNQRVTRAYKALSAGNRTLLRERNELELQQAMCKVAVEHAGYSAAYVLYARMDEEKRIEVVAQYGADQGFITAVPLTWAGSGQAQLTISPCIQSGERVILRSIAADPRAAPWHAAAAKSGFMSMISLPLRVQNVLVGTFSLAAADENAFDEGEVALLDEMAADLSFGMEVIRAEVRRKEAELIARHALTQDRVVDLPNLTGFLEQVSECIQRARGNGEPVAVLDLHIGCLQDVFDSFGYECGNMVLRQVADRLKRVPGCEDFIGRIPIDDFGIVLCGHDATVTVNKAHEILEIFNQSFSIGATLIDIQASVGATFFPGHGEDAETLVRRASIAAREGFRREVPYHIYGGATTRENPARLSLAKDLRAAIETRALMLHYQPKVNTASGEPSGCEALVRWRHPALGMIPPMEFVGLAEDIGLIRLLTHQVIDMAVRQQHAWAKAGAMPVAVNLSARNLLDPKLFDVLDGVFATWGLARDLIHFEITESALVDDPNAARLAIQRLCEGGARVYIDDFGTGFSSLQYLVKLPVHALKVDRSFIEQMTKSPEARSVVASIISMAHNLDLKVIAEGVETGEDYAILRDMGCDEVQGYFIARPMDADAYKAWLLRGHRDYAR